MLRKPNRLIAVVLAFVFILSNGAGLIAFAYAVGDVDGSGKVDSTDARLALRAAAKLDTLTIEQFSAADVDSNGKVDSVDARMILRVAARLDTFPEPATQPTSPTTPHASGETTREQITGDELKKYQALNPDLEITELYRYKKGGAEHVWLDDYETVEFDVSAIPDEERQSYLCFCLNEETGEPFWFIPDPEARIDGKLRIETLHYSLFGYGKPSENDLLVAWANKAAAQSETRRISVEELTPGLAQMLEDCGLAQNQYGGAIARAVLSLDTRGEILTAAIDCDGKTLQAKLANFAGEYILGKLLKQDEDQFLTQSLGDNADSVKKAIKEGKYNEALTAIVKNIEKNMFPYVNYADKIASLTDKLADIWADDMMNEQYEVYKKLGGTKISDDDWNIVYMQLRGAANRLSSKGISAETLRKKFDQRAQNETKIAERQKELLKDAAGWRRLGLMDNRYWYDSYGNYPSDTERLNSLLQTREMLQDLLTLNGKFQRGKGYLTDKDFLEDALATWVINGVKGRENFYKWLREKGVYLQGEDNVPTDSAWVLVETHVDVRENTNTGIYKDTFSASQGQHSHTTAYIGDEEKTQHASFTGTCDAPPAVIHDGDEVVLNLSLNLTDSNDKDYHFSESASVRRDIPDIDIGSVYSGFARFTATAEGEPDRCSVDAIGDWGNPPVRITSATVCHTFGNPSKEYAKKMADGSYRIAVYFSACGAQTVWVYEWKNIA
ncbi:MAG: dockerin type I repeat-containing protein [Clostridia bacterium]|nr:dockerin type I repeat-containing protein [Clostridia bacterium]